MKWAHTGSMRVQSLGSEWEWKVHLMIAVSHLTSGPTKAAIPAKLAAEAGSICCQCCSFYSRTNFKQTTSVSPSGIGVALGDAEVTQGKSQKGNQTFRWSGA